MLTNLQMRRIEALRKITFQPATRKKMFARAMMALNPMDEITPKQDLYLAQIIHHFRRQVSDKSLIPSPQELSEKP